MKILTNSLINGGQVVEITDGDNVQKAIEFIQQTISTNDLAGSDNGREIILFTNYANVSANGAPHFTAAQSNTLHPVGGTVTALNNNITFSQPGIGKGTITGRGNTGTSINDFYVASGSATFITAGNKTPAVNTPAGENFALGGQATGNTQFSGKLIINTSNTSIYLQPTASTVYNYIGLHAENPVLQPTNTENPTS